MRFTGFLPFEPRFGEGMASTAVAVHLRTVCKDCHVVLLELHNIVFPQNLEPGRRYLERRGPELCYSSEGEDDLRARLEF
jgi:hypothetical protein